MLCLCVYICERQKKLNYLLYILHSERCQEEKGDKEFFSIIFFSINISIEIVVNIYLYIILCTVLTSEKRFFLF